MRFFGASSSSVSRIDVVLADEDGEQRRVTLTITSN
jgi:hypothetical protein